MSYDYSSARGLMVGTPLGLQRVSFAVSYYEPRHLTHRVRGRICIRLRSSGFGRGIVRQGRFPILNAASISASKPAFQAV